MDGFYEKPPKCQLEKEGPDHILLINAIKETIKVALNSISLYFTPKKEKNMTELRTKFTLESLKEEDQLFNLCEQLLDWFDGYMQNNCYFSVKLCPCRKHADIQICKNIEFEEKNEETEKIEKYLDSFFLEKNISRWKTFGNHVMWIVSFCKDIENDEKVMDLLSKIRENTKNVNIEFYVRKNIFYGNFFITFYYPNEELVPNILNYGGILSSCLFETTVELLNQRGYCKIEQPKEKFTQRIFLIPFKEAGHATISTLFYQILTLLETSTSKDYFVAIETGETVDKKPAMKITLKTEFPKLD